jgi:hypothetical protein
MTLHIFRRMRRSELRNPDQYLYCIFMKMLDPDHHLPSIFRGIAALCESPKTKATNQVYADLNPAHQHEQKRNSRQMLSKDLKHHGSRFFT